MWDDDSVTDVNIDDVFRACDINQNGMCKARFMFVEMDKLLETDILRLLSNLPCNALLFRIY